MLVSDVRVYSGAVTSSFFKFVYDCGQKESCMRLARSSPATRRVFCVLATISGVTSSSCGASMYYDGAAIDVKASMDMAGVMFSFRDTAWDEVGFEIERKAVGDEASKFKTVISVDSGLKGCASDFASITYVDRDASFTPNSVWLYRMVTKFPKEQANGLEHTTSPYIQFTTPWFTQMSGSVFAGGTIVGVAGVRICVEFSDVLQHENGTLKTFDERSAHVDLAKNMPVKHS